MKTRKPCIYGTKHRYVFVNIHTNEIKEARQMFQTDAEQRNCFLVGIGSEMRWVLPEYFRKPRQPVQTAAHRQERKHDV